MAAEWSRWVEVRFPLAPDNFPRQLLDGLLEGKSAWGAWGVASLLSMVGYSALRAAREASRPAGQSSGGKAQVVIRTERPCVGAVLEGHLKLLATPAPDQVFQVALRCRFSDRSLGKTRNGSMFEQSVEVKPMRAADGWHLPFRFEVPADAPPSTTHDDLVEPFVGRADVDHSWFIEFFPADKWIAVPSRFPVGLEAAPVSAASG
jgi:hypothetical protein